MTEHMPHAELARRAVEEAAPEVGRFVGTILGSASMQLDAMLGERVGWWRMKQSVHLMKKAQKLLDDAGLQPHQVPYRTSVPLLEAGSLEDDPDLCDRWASLLANAAATPDSVPPAFVSVLRELEPDSARVLDIIYKQYMSLHEDFRDEFAIYLEPDEIPPRFLYHVDNLARLGLLRTPGVLEGLDRYSSLVMTRFGAEFVRACRPPGEPDPPLEWLVRADVERHIAERGAPPAPTASEGAAAP